MEHYCTLFDYRYLPQGMALHASLLKHEKDFCLWVLCMDKKVEQALQKLALPSLRIIPLESIETEELLKIKSTRSAGEYCWTLTPFLPGYVMDSNPNIHRATYIDADCYFFSSPSSILKELDDSGKDLLITPHDYLPQYDLAWISGYYCVQFMPFCNTPGGRKVMRWWQERCLEWCYAKPDNGRFGDQKYLDDWADRFDKEVHVLRNSSLTQAPWNLQKYYPNAKTCMYHFHGLRLLGNNKGLAYIGFKISEMAYQSVYLEYFSVIAENFKKMRNLGLDPSTSKLTNGPRTVWKRLKWRWKGELRFVRFSE